MKRKKKVNISTRQQVMTDAEKMLYNLPVQSILFSMETQLRVLENRGIEIRDFDHKEKAVKQIRLIGGKAYFLATGSENKVEEYLDTIGHLRKYNLELMKTNKKLQAENIALRKKLQIGDEGQQDEAGTEFKE